MLGTKNNGPLLGKMFVLRTIAKICPFISDISKKLKYDDGYFEKHWAYMYSIVQ
jgi:hypothetical protein